ncbi:hypothetical protein ACFWP5_04315 [Streptomyces sp. NPDC058469]|uniref:hypothetical protein n=1 Tax=Streptomyces sp. NPDC058469 TaxID=3346514 RepID=UPI00365BA5B7
MLPVEFFDEVWAERQHAKIQVVAAMRGWGGPDRRARQRAQCIAPRRAERRDRPGPTAAGTPDESDAPGLPDNA